MTIVFGTNRLPSDGSMHMGSDMRHLQWSSENEKAGGRSQHDTHLARLTQVLAATTEDSSMGSALLCDGVVTV